MKKNYAAVNGNGGRNARVNSAAAEKEEYKGLPNIPGTSKELLETVALVKYNAGIRRFTALNMINYLKQTGVVDKEADVYIRFLWDKFQIVSNGLASERRYNEVWVITCIANSFSNFANSASAVLSDYVRSENIPFNSGEENKDPEPQGQTCD